MRDLATAGKKTFAALAAILCAAFLLALSLAACYLATLPGAWR